jgi:hypothetical protein
MEVGDRQAVITALREYKGQNGHPNFPALFSIPTSQRIPELAKTDLKRAAALVTVGLKSAMESMNISRPMNNTQILDLTDAILETSEEDNLAVEDLMLFLQKLVRGEYGVLYESMDIPKFMEKFEKYREDRFQVMQSIRYEQASNHRPDYSDTRISEQKSMEENLKNVAALVLYSQMINEGK